MNNLALSGTVSTTAAILGFNAAIAAGEDTWPDQVQIYVTEQSNPTFSFFEDSVLIIPPTPLHEFANSVANVFASLSEGQEPLGAEFEAIWDENVDLLYQP